MEDIDVSQLLSRVSALLAETESRCAAYKKTYEDLSYVWNTDLDAMFTTFCEVSYDELVSEAPAAADNAGGGGDTEEAGAPGPPPVTISVPNLRKFEEQISKYRRLQAQIAKLEVTTDIGWLRIDSDPVKQALMSWASRWVALFTDHLSRFVIDKLSSLEAFMNNVRSGLKAEVDAERTDKEALKLVMGHIRDVKKVTTSWRMMFGPLRNALALLRVNGVDLAGVKVGGSGADVNDFLEAVPKKWESMVDETFKKRELILPIQASEMENVKGTVRDFFEHLREFRNEFRAKSPHSFEGKVEEAYALIDAYVLRNDALERQSRLMNELEELFELQVRSRSLTLHRWRGGGG